MAKEELPVSFNDWKRFAREHGVADNALSQIGESSSVSGSKLPYTAMLQFRTIWPNPLKPSSAWKRLRRTGYYDTPSLCLAKNLLDSRAPAFGSDKLYSFISHISSQENPNPQTPEPLKPRSTPLFKSAV